jgi:hypothetical protein
MSHSVAIPFQGVYGAIAPMVKSPRMARHAWWIDDPLSINNVYLCDTGVSGRASTIELARHASDHRGIFDRVTGHRRARSISAALITAGRIRWACRTARPPVIWPRVSEPPLATSTRHPRAMEPCSIVSCTVASQGLSLALRLESIDPAHQSRHNALQ